MSDYIEREDALKAVEDIVCDADDAERTCDRIIDIPAADVAPVRHGRWVTTYRYGFPIWECSECGTQTGTANFPYCYDCGARMDDDDKWEE